MSNLVADFSVFGLMQRMKCASVVSIRLMSDESCDANFKPTVGLRFAAAPAPPAPLWTTERRAEVWLKSIATSGVVDDMSTFDRSAETFSTDFSRKPSTA